MFSAPNTAANASVFLPIFCSSFSLSEKGIVESETTFIFTPYCFSIVVASLLNADGAFILMSTFLNPTPASAPYFPFCASACKAELVSSKLKLASLAVPPACASAAETCGTSIAPSLAPAAITFIIRSISLAAAIGSFKSTLNCNIDVVSASVAPTTSFFIVLDNTLAYLPMLPKASELFAIPGPSLDKIV